MLLAVLADLLLAVRAAAEVAVGEVAVGEVAAVASLTAATVAAVVPFAQHRRHGSIQGRGRSHERQSHAVLHRRLQQQQSQQRLHLKPCAR
jgi:hypothetical protein